MKLSEWENYLSGFYTGNFLSSLILLAFTSNMKNFWEGVEKILTKEELMKLEKWGQGVSVEKKLLHDNITLPQFAKPPFKPDCW